jgi:amino acid adenylation domain-containing protein
MTLRSATPSRVERADAALSLYHLLDPEVLADPYPLFHRLRREDPVHWDSYLHAWLVTRYADVLEVLHSYSADRTPTPAQLTEMGLSELKPIAQVMIKQMLFLDAPGHTRLRGLASKAFTPARVETLKTHIRDIVNNLLDKVQAKGRMDVIAELAEPLPAIVTAELLGVPVSDHKRLKGWSANFAEMLGNFQHNPDRAPLMLRTVEEMTAYFQEAIREIKAHPREGLIHSLLTAEVDGDRLTEEEVIANAVVTMVGGQETTTNLIGNGLLTLLRNPEEMKRLRSDLSLIPSAVEEMLRYESPSQHTARLAPSDRELGGKQIRKRQAVIAVMAAANRDPERFPDPDRFDIARPDNRHLAFGYAAHFCFGAPLARAEGQIAFQAILQRLNNLRLEPQSLIWRNNLGLRGLTALSVSFGDEAEPSGPEGSRNQREAASIVAETRSGAEARQADITQQDTLQQDILQEDILQQDILQQDMAYWRSKLKAVPGLLELPTDRPRPVQRSFDIASESTTLSPSLVDELKALGKREHATLFGTLLSIFKALLSRYGQREDILVSSQLSTPEGTVADGNLVALRTDLSGDPSFHELLARVQNTALEACQHRNTPFGNVAPEVCPDFKSFFQVFFSMPESSVPAANLRGPNSEDAKNNLDLACAVVPDGEGLTIRFDYATDLFDASTIRRMLESFRAILETALIHPDQRLSVLPLLGATEAHRILIEWNSTEAIRPADQCIHQLFEGQVERAPDAVAVRHGGEKLTYRELNVEANRLAHYLRGVGAGPDIPVGICLLPSLSLVVALLAVMKAGGACLPLDPGYPAERLQFMLDDAQVPVLLTSEALRAQLERPGTAIVCIDSQRAAIAKESRDNPACDINPANLAYVIYTSGSTGKPRGVLLTHAGLANHNLASIKLYDLKPGDRVLQFSSISFDIAIEEIWPALLTGASLILRPANFSLAVADFLHCADQEGITVFDLPTAYWHELVHGLSEGAGTLPKSLRLVIVGGEKASAPLLRTWRTQVTSGVRWINTYGPTEASVIATAYEPAAGEVPDPLPIGKPIDNVRTYILDRNLQPVPVGVPGELHIGGLGVARGYLNRPELTTEKFVSDAFCIHPGARLYKTGDLVRYLPSGDIEFLGRRDFQVKIRGFRVELGEIEAALARHSEVREAVVIAREEGLNGKRLVAYLVSLPGSTPAPSELRSYLKRQLPDYMVPSDFVLLDELPLTPNGKIDRSALPAPSAEQTSAGDYAPPSDAVESQLVGMWEEILGRRPIGIRDNFFELGGHSLLAVRLMRRIDRGFGRTVPLAALFEAPTIEQFAAILRQPQSTLGTSLIVPIQPKGSRPPFFCVHGLGGAVLRFQELARHMAPDQPFYGIQPQGINGDKPVLESVEEMAACYIGEMRKFQSEGPYYIGGYSFGGLVAFEMARQLHSNGQEIGLLALLDTYPGKAKSKAVLLSTLLALPREQQSAYVARKLKKYRRGLRRRFDALFLPKPLKLVHKTLARAEAMYQPEVYYGAATWFRASEKALRGLDDPQSDWATWAAAGVETHEIDGDHGAIMKAPMVGVLAQQLRASLEKAQQQRLENTLATQIQRQTTSGLNCPQATPACTST